MQRLSYPTETVLSNKVTRKRIVLSFKDSPRKPLGRRPRMMRQTCLLLLRFPRSRSRSFSICAHSAMIGRNYRTMAHSICSSGAHPRARRNEEQCQKPKALPEPERTTNSIYFSLSLITMNSLLMCGRGRCIR